MRHLASSQSRYQTLQQQNRGENIIKYNQLVKEAFEKDAKIAEENAKPKHRAVRVSTNFAKLAMQKNNEYQGLK